MQVGGYGLRPGDGTSGMFILFIFLLEQCWNVFFRFELPQIEVKVYNMCILCILCIIINTKLVDREDNRGKWSE